MISESGASEHSRAHILEGVKRALPIVLGYVPVAFAFGVLAVKNDMSPAFAITMSIFLFAGSAQFVTAGLWGAGVGVLSIIMTVFVVNLRHMLMSASLAAHLQQNARWQRFLVGCELTDETFVVHSAAIQQGWRVRLATLYACNATAHASWVAGTVVGVYFGALIEDVRPLGLDYALTAMFLALLIPQCRTRVHVLVAACGGLASVGLKSAGFGQWNVIIATLVAATIGLVLTRKLGHHDK